MLVQKTMTLFTAVTAVFLMSASIVHASEGDDGHFTFMPDEGVSTAEFAHIQDALEGNRAAIMAELRLTALPTVIVRIWRDEERYQQAMEAALGGRAPGSRGYIVSDHEMRLLLTDRPTAPREAVHEFVHVASLNLNPDIGNNPRWLWEAAAIYLAGETPHGQAIFLFQNGKCPSLASLNEPFSQGGSVYDVGYYLMKFVVNDWGKEAVAALIETNGDTEAVLGVNAAAFEARWCAFVRAKYAP